MHAYGDSMVAANHNYVSIGKQNRTCFCHSETYIAYNSTLMYVGCSDFVSAKVWWLSCVSNPKPTFLQVTAVLPVLVTDAASALLGAQRHCEDLSITRIADCTVFFFMMINWCTEEKSVQTPVNTSSNFVMSYCPIGGMFVVVSRNKSE